MTLFCSYTYPEGKDLDAGKVITTPPGLLDFNLRHFPVCDSSPLAARAPCKERQQRVLTHCAVSPRVQAESTLQGIQWGTWVWEG